jgi:hypothetical protein
MSNRRARRAEGRLRAQKRELVRKFEGGARLAGSADAPGRPGILQTVSVHHGSPDGVLVQVEYYRSTDWDSNLEESEHSFSSLEEAFAWIETECSVHWSQLSAPG